MRKWLKIVFGILAFILMIVGIVYAQQMQRQATMNEPEIIIRIKDENSLISKEEVNEYLKINDLFHVGMTFEQIDFDKIERELKNMSQILDVKVYAQIGNDWKINILQKKPIVRIFNSKNKSYYIDEFGSIIKSDVYHSSKVLVANGNITDDKRVFGSNSIINSDSLKTISSLNQIYLISKYVCNNPFLSAQISQVYLREDGDFILVPQIGDQVIVFGTAHSESEIKRKFEKLSTFYKEGIAYEGWDKYKEINLKYSKQIVCKKK